MIDLQLLILSSPIHFQTPNLVKQVKPKETYFILLKIHFCLMMTFCSKLLNIKFYTSRELLVLQNIS